MCTFDIVPSPGALSRTILPRQASRAVLRKGPPKAPITGIASPWATTQVHPSSSRTRHRCSSGCAHHTSPAIRLPPLKALSLAHKVDLMHAKTIISWNPIPNHSHSSQSIQESIKVQGCKEYSISRPCRLISHTQVKQ